MLSNRTDTFARCLPRAVLIADSDDHDEDCAQGFHVRVYFTVVVSRLHRQGPLPSNDLFDTFA